jgi:hypothetical protein
MTGDPEQVNLYSLLDIVQEWMTESFAEKASNDGLIVGSNSTTFNSLGLEPRTDDGDDATAAADNTNGGGGGGGRKKNRLLLRRQLQDLSTLSLSATSVSVFTANFEGVTLWNRVGSTTSPLDPEIVQLIQRATFLEDDVLLAKLRSADAFTGLGSNVADVKVFVVSTTDETTNTDDSEKGIGSDPLQIIIIIAIVVACLAFALLMFAVIWAWRTDQARRDYSNSKGGGSKNANNYDRHGGAIPQIATKSESYDMDIPLPRPPARKAPPAIAITTNKKNKKGMVAAPVSAPVATTTATTSNYTNTHSYDNGDSTDVSEMPSPADYDGSVISEDISTSLTAYYRSGVAGYSVGTSGRQAPSASRGAGGGGDFNDNASMSSMDSYGYSLDGYAPSLGPAPQGYPVGSSLYNGLIKDPETDYSEEEDDAQDYSNMNSTTDTGRVNV